MRRAPPDDTEPLTTRRNDGFRPLQAIAIDAIADVSAVLWSCIAEGGAVSHGPILPLGPDAMQALEPSTLPWVPANSRRAYSCPMRGLRERLDARPRSPSRTDPRLDAAGLRPGRRDRHLLRSPGDSDLRRGADRLRGGPDAESGARRDVARDRRTALGAPRAGAAPASRGRSRKPCFSDQRPFSRSSASRRSRASRLIPSTMWSPRASVSPASRIWEM
jgi:hypothetical protein